MKNDEAILELRDLISDNNTDRENEALLHAIETIRYVNEKVKAADDVIKAFKRPHGKWIIDGHHRRCNYCNEYTCTEDREGNSIPDNFCPFCGAEMQKGGAE